MVKVNGKQYEQVNLNEQYQYYYHAKFDIYKVLNKPRHTTDQKKSKLSPLNTHQSHTNHIVHDLFVFRNHTIFKPQRTKIQNTQFAAQIYYSMTNL